jgi:hypothetical protein
MERSWLELCNIGDRQPPIALRVRLGDCHFEIPQPTRSHRNSAHHEFDRMADDVGLPSLGEPSLRGVGHADHARVLGIKALQAHERVGEFVGF